MSWQGRKVFITGASGLVGSWLAEALVTQGAQVTVLLCDFHPQSYFAKAFPQCHIVYGVLEDINAVERALALSEADTVFHLGAQTIVDHALASPFQTFESNVRGTYNLLEACRRQPKLIKSIVMASTDKAYGESAKLPYVETMPLQGIHPYDASKVCLEAIGRSYEQTYNMPIIMVRCGNIYGGGDLNFSRLIPGTIRSLFLDEAPVIRSDGKFIRDYVYVKNVAQVYMALADLLHKGKAKGEVFNYSDDQPLTVLDVVGRISRLMGKKIKPVILDQAKHEIRDQHLSSAKLKKFISVKSLADIDASLKETIHWYSDFLKK